MSFIKMLSRIGRVKSEPTRQGAPPRPPVGGSEETGLYIDKGKRGYTPQTKRAEDGSISARVDPDAVVPLRLMTREDMDTCCACGEPFDEVIESTQHEGMCTLCVCEQEDGMRRSRELEFPSPPPSSFLDALRVLHGLGKLGLQEMINAVRVRVPDLEYTMTPREIGGQHALIIGRLPYWMAKGHLWRSKTYKGDSESECWWAAVQDLLPQLDAHAREEASHA